MHDSPQVGRPNMRVHPGVCFHNHGTWHPYNKQANKWVPELHPLWGSYCAYTQGSMRTERKPWWRHSRDVTGEEALLCPASPALRPTSQGGVRGSEGTTHLFHVPCDTSRRAEASALPDQYADDTWSASPLSSLIPTPQFRNVSSIWGAPRGAGSKGLRRGLIQIRQRLWRESGGNISRMWHTSFCVSSVNTAFSASTVTSGISVDLSWCPWHDRPDTSRPIYSARRRVGDRLYQKWLSLEFLGSCGCPGSC